MTKGGKKEKTREAGSDERKLLENYLFDFDYWKIIYLFSIIARWLINI